VIVTERAGADPASAAELMESWELSGAARDQALGALAVGTAGEDVDAALERARSIQSSAIRDQIMVAIAERRPAAEAVSIAQQVTDSLVRSGVQANAAVNLAPEDLDTALVAAKQASVAPDSIRAQLAVAAASADVARALEVARTLPARPRAWALGMIAVEIAAAHPEEAERLLAEADGFPEAARLAAVRMAGVAPDRAVEVAQSISEEGEREAALAALACTFAEADPERAAALTLAMTSPVWRARAVEPAVLRAARTDHDTATSLIGYVAQPSLAMRLRAQVGARVAVRDPEAGFRLLNSLPASECRTDYALQAGTGLLSAGDAPETAVRLGSIGVERDLALRWMLPTLADSQTRSPVNVAAEIGNPYLRAMALADVAEATLGLERRCRPVPERGRRIRPIVEWEGA
jgi:hypothetical protein